MSKETDQFEKKQKKNNDQRIKINDEISTEKQTNRRLINLAK